MNHAIPPSYVISKSTIEKLVDVQWITCTWALQRFSKLPLRMQDYCCLKKKIRYVGISYIVEIKHVNAYIWLNDGQEERAFSFK